MRVSEMNRLLSRVTYEICDLHVMSVLRKSAARVAGRCRRLNTAGRRAYVMSQGKRCSICGSRAKVHLYNYLINNIYFMIYQIYAIVCLLVQLDTIILTTYETCNTVSTYNQLKIVVKFYPWK